MNLAGADTLRSPSAADRQRLLRTDIVMDSYTAEESARSHLRTLRGKPRKAWV